MNLLFFINYAKKYIYLPFIYFCLYNYSLLSNNTDNLIFYHIPKTGGTTITFLLNQQFDSHVICPDDFYFQIEKRSLEDLNHFKFFRGHFFFNSILKFLRNSRKIVFLREPIQRVLSEQRFLKTLCVGRESALYLEHFLEGSPIETMSNHQCLFLSSFDRNDSSITPEMHLASAKENLLKEFFFVGITERIEESLQALYMLMGWQIPNIIPRLNETNLELENINSQVLEEIRQRNLLDIELYEFAQGLLDSKLNQLNIHEKETPNSD